jgi:endo-1,4-beta-xylanase
MKQLHKIYLTGLLLFLSNFIFSQNEPVIVQAESGTLGADFSTLNSAGVQYVTVVSDGTGDNPVSAARVVTYNVTFPSAGTYDLYMRVRVGPAGGSDDSYFYASGFGVKTFTNADWITVNNIASGGFTGATDIISGTGSAGMEVW